MLGVIDFITIISYNYKVEPYEITDIELFLKYKNR